MGLALAVLCVSALAFFSIYPGRYGPDARRPGGGDPFHRGLREYDVLFARYKPGNDGDAGVDAGVLNRILERLEKMTLGAESRLSILKRRRNLARRDSRYQSLYREKALKAAADFPHTESIAAVAADSLLAENIAIDDETRGLLADLSSRIREPSLSPLVVAVQVLSGNLDEPSRAAAIPGMAKLFSSALAFPGKVPSINREALWTDAAILSILAGDIPGALAGINNYLAPADVSGGDGGPLLRGGFPRFAAEVFYDFGNPQRAAELFGLFQDDYSRSRAADALWLAGQGAGARNIWAALGGSPKAARNRSLYNLAVSAGNQQEELIRLEDLFAGDSPDEPWYEDPLTADEVYLYGIIRYTRLLNSSRTLAILDRGNLSAHPLLDLEIHRRREETLSTERAVADSWMLLGRHPGNEELHQWAAWYFTYQRRYDELALLIRSIEKQGAQGILIGGPWLDNPWLKLHKSLSLMRDFRLEEAAQILQPPADDPAIAASFWQIPANLGRIMESRRSFNAALEYYEIAAAEVKDPKAASELQYRISLCFRALGQAGESRRALEHALELNPDNLKVRAELSRLDSPN
ncbi:hypothetical protein FACS1894147_04670 [Spirochaetia bacterium]|nr:hypothetical protein FACS1894147_04670 [Spirochaetia bacterium]